MYTDFVMRKCGVSMFTFVMCMFVCMCVGVGG